MTTFSDLKIFENPEINTYIDRLYHYVSQNFGCSWPEAQQRICLTGSVARVLVGFKSEESVKDLDFTTNCAECFEFLKENSKEIFGVGEKEIHLSNSGINIQTPFILLEIFFNAENNYQIVKLENGIILKII